MTQQEVAAKIHEFNEQHAQMNYYEDLSMVILMGVIALCIIVTGIIDNRKGNKV